MTHRDEPPTRHLFTISPPRGWRCTLCRESEAHSIHLPLTPPKYATEPTRD